MSPLIIKKEETARRIRVVILKIGRMEKVDILGLRVKNIVNESISLNCYKNTFVNKIIDFTLSDLSIHKPTAIVYVVSGLEKTGNLLNSPLFPLLKGVDLVELTAKISKIKTFALNELDCAARGISVSSPKEDFFTLVNWDDYFSFKNYEKGRIVNFKEGGHIKFDFSFFAPLCECGERGCINAIIQGQNIERRIIEEAKTIGIKIPIHKSPIDFLLSEYEKSDNWAIGFLNSIGIILGDFLGNIEKVFFSPLIIWRGNLAKKFLHIIECLLKDKINEEVNFKFTPFDNDHDTIIGVNSLFDSKGNPIQEI